MVLEESASNNPQLWEDYTASEAVTGPSLHHEIAIGIKRSLNDAYELLSM